MGQPSCNFFQIQCDRQPASWGQYHMFKPKTVTARRKHLQRVLTRCKYPVWALNRVKIKMKTLAQKNKKKNKSFNTGHQQ